MAIIKFREFLNKLGGGKSLMQTAAEQQKPRQSMAFPVGEGLSEQQTKTAIKIVGTPSGVKPNIVKEAVQGLPRLVGSFAAEITGQPIQFGRMDPILPISQQFKESEEKYGKTFGAPIAGIGLSLSATDAILPGKGKLAKEASEYAAELLAKKLSKQRVARLVEAKYGKEIAEAVTQRLITGTPTTPIDPLIQEARKYKSAEEFVNKIQGSATQYGDYTPQFRHLGMEDYKNVAELGVKPDKMVTIYRGIDDISGKIPRKINDGDFVTTDFDSAASYAGKDNVVSMKVPAKTLYTDAIDDFKADPFYIGSEYVYTTEKVEPLTKSQLTDIWNKANKVEATPTPPVTRSGTKERGFVRSVKQALPEVKATSTYSVRNTDNLAIRAANLVKDNIQVAEQVARRSDDMGVAVASELIKHYGRLAEKADPVAKMAFYDKAGEIATETAVRLTQAGREVQAASILSRQTPEGMLRFAAREIQKYNEGLENSKLWQLGWKKKIPDLTPQQSKEILEEAKRVQAMPDGDEKAIAFNKLSEKIAALTPSPLYKKLIGLWKAGLLTGLKTSGLNIASNTAHSASEVIKDIPASVVDIVASLFTGKRTNVFTLRGTVPGIKEGAIKGWRYVRTGYDARDIGTKLDIKRINFGKGKIAKALQAYEESVFRVIGAEDQPFYYAAKSRSLYSQAIAQAKNAGLRGKPAKEFAENLLANPTDEMLKAATMDAEMAVFQNQTALGKVAKGIQNVPGGELVVPFGRTPAAVATQLINYSPIGAVKAVVENIGRGKFNQRAFSQAMGRALTGTAGLWAGMELFKRGRISLGYPETERERKQWELEGRKENSIKIGGKWRSIGALGPMGNVFVVGGYIQQGLDDSGSLSQAFAQAASGGARSLTEQTFLRGLNQFTSAISDPEGYGPGLLASTVGSVVPTIVADVARASDPLERRTSPTKEGMTAPIQSRIPGLRQQLEPKVDVLGQDINRPTNIVESMADPTRPTDVKTSPVISEFRRLEQAGFPVTPTDFGNDKPMRQSLTDQQRTELQRRAGQLLETKLSRLFTMPSYTQMTDEEKADTVSKFTNQARLVAKAEMVQNILDQSSNKKDTLSQLKRQGFLTKSVFDKWVELFGRP